MTDKATYSDVVHRQLLTAVAALLVGAAACGDSAPSNGMEASTPRDFTLPFPEDDMAMSQVDAGTCANQVQDGDESDVDCGGTCMGCGEGKMCNAAKDCMSGACANKMCLAPTCMDTIKNGTESDVDCGGSCPTKCENGQACGDGPDCKSGFCLNGKCMASQCQDNMRNGMETDVDCGGPMCPACTSSHKCMVGSDCESMKCNQGICRAKPGVLDFLSTDTMLNTDINYGAYLVTADFNQDKNPDLVVNHREKNVGGAYVGYLGLGNGTFKLAGQPTVSLCGPTWTAVSDFNNDGKLDLACDSAQLASALGRGDGTFAPGQQRGMGLSSVNFIAAGDFNEDGAQDVVDGCTSGVQLYLGDGNGSFKFPALAVSNYSKGGSSADLDGDGHLDLLTSTDVDTVRVFLGDGHGAFAAPLSLMAGSAPQQPIAADLNGDSKLDVAVGDNKSSDCTVWLGQGGGNFGSGKSTPLGGAPTAVVASDFNRDGRKDLAFLTVLNGTTSITVVLGKGDGTFQAPKAFPLNVALAGNLVAADFDKDGHADLATVKWNLNGYLLSVFMNISG